MRKSTRKKIRKCKDTSEYFIRLRLEIELRKPPYQQDQQLIENLRNALILGGAADVVMDIIDIFED